MKEFWRVVELFIISLWLLMTLMFIKTHRTKHEQEQITACKVDFTF